ncbi:MAG: DnaJ domain-containing protein [Phycisphaeraceae bacterium]|nr:DnaJ domain-containing protein [Phycisphaeraceae bacterium]
MTSSPFEILGLPRTFDLDEGAIRRAYLARVAALHPDLAEAEDAQAESAELNRARDVLVDPESRANLLLSLLGGPPKEADKSLPPAFLMEIMETREAIESSLASGDEAERKRWSDWGLKERSKYVGQVKGQFAGLGASPDPGALRELRKTLNAWRYIERLIEQLDPAYDPNSADFNSP